VIAPAAGISRLDWLTNAEDDARSEVASLADTTAEATPTEDVEGRVGDSDPIKAIEDALRTFAADETLIVARPRRSGWLVGGGQRRGSPGALQPSDHVRLGSRRWIARETRRLAVVPEHVGSSGPPWRLSAVEAAQLQGGSDESAR
jgi:hypothetical protein